MIASCLSEDHSFNVALIKAEEQWPDISLLPIAPAAMQLNSTTDWMYTTISEKPGSGSTADASRCRAERYWRLVRDQLHGLCECHPGDFDSEAEGGATGWSYVEVLPYFRESEGLAPDNEISVDGPARDTTGARPDTAGRAPIRLGGGRRRHPTRRL